LDIRRARKKAIEGGLPRELQPGSYYQTENGQKRQFSFKVESTTGQIVEAILYSHVSRFIYFSKNIDLKRVGSC
jgi:hypothetical protein